MIFFIFLVIEELFIFLYKLVLISKCVSYIISLRYKCIVNTTTSETNTLTNNDK